MTEFFAQCTERNNWVILTVKVESLAELKFDLKSWVTGGIIIRPGKMSNWKIFESNGLSMLSQSDFDVESIWLSMLIHHDSQCWVNLTLNVESVWISIFSQLDSQCWVNLTLNVESIRLKYSPVTHFAGSNFIVLPVTQLFMSKWLNFFLAVYYSLQTLLFWTGRLDASINQSIKISALVYRIRYQILEYFL